MDDKQMEGLERHWASKNPVFKEKIPIHGISDSMSEFQHLEELKEEGLIGKGIWEKYHDASALWTLDQVETLNEASWLRL